MTRVIDAREVSKRFYLRHNRSGELKVRFLGLFDPGRRERLEEFWALRRVSLSVDAGEAVALVGRNGSGKSTLLKLIAGLHQPTAGRLLVASGARIGTMIELGVGFHGELTGEENVYLNAAIHGLTRAEIRELLPKVVEYSGLEHFMQVPIKNYSSGMHMRLGFAVAANLRPDILLIDEIFAVGDQDFQQQCMATLQQFQNRGGTLLFVSHSPAAVRAVCRRVCLLDGGILEYDGEVERGLAQYDRLLAAARASPDEVRTGFRARPVHAALTEAELDVAWHRMAVGGHWAEAGRWQAEFLKAAGLRPSHYVLDVGCGSLAAAVHLLPYMEQSHYWGYDPDRHLFEAGVQIELARANVEASRGHFVVNDGCDLSEIPHAFDYAMANSSLGRMDDAAAGRCVAAVIRKLAPGGRFYITWLERAAPSADHAAAPVPHRFETFATIAESLGCTASRVDDASHPRGDSIVVVQKPR